MADAQTGSRVPHKRLWVNDVHMLEGACSSIGSLWGIQSPHPMLMLSKCYIPWHAMLLQERAALALTDAAAESLR